MLRHRPLPSIVMLCTLAAVCPAAPATASPEPRVPVHIDDMDRRQLSGNTHPGAAAWSDRGRVEADFPMTRLQLVLKRSAAQDAELAAFMKDQLDRASPNYHRWLTPAEFGALYGPADADIAALSHWLAGHGFVVDAVNQGRTVIEFSGSAGQVGAAFHTEIHRYEVNREMHVANAGDPSIPAALADVVAGVVSLDNFFVTPLHRDLGAMRRNPASGTWMPVDSAHEQAQDRAPLAGTMFAPGGISGYQLVSPDDFAMLYNVLPLWNTGIDGTGQTIAIAGRSDIKLTDVASFRAAFGLPANAPTVIINGPDPGVPSAGEKLESTLDVEWSGAVAKGAHIVFVTTASGNTSDGAAASALYIIEHRTAPVMSFSYGTCELELGTAGNAYYNSLWQQAAAEGIAVFVATGDQGSAGCDVAPPAPYGAQKGLAVNGTASTPYDIAVGGTDLNWVNLPSNNYWAAGTVANGAAALQYIPEVPWNGSCASLAYEQSIGSTASGLDPEQYCNSLLSQGAPGASPFNGGGGGASACTTPNSSAPAGCGGGYSKPSWQSGPGVPADGRRDVPDVALFAASGTLHTAYAVCDSDSAPCNYAVPGDAMAQAIGGTSVAAPAMAGIMALINQKMGAPQGNAAAGLYALAARDNRAACNSATVAAGNACNFHDITTDGNAVPCVANSPNCLVQHSGDALGILSGNKSGIGYDLATGLGSVNATNLVNNWHLTGGAVAVVTVPNVVGSTQAVAGAAIAQAGAIVGSTTAQWNATVKAGSVVSQSPAGGAQVAPGTSVNLTLSSGKSVIVPNEIGATKTAAGASLQSAGVALGTVILQSTGCFAPGTVIGQSPTAGTAVAAGSSVSLVVASAAPAIKVPNTVGAAVSSAGGILTAAGLKVGTQTSAASTSAQGQVMSQSPAAGAKVAACSSVNLVVSSGPPPVRVPNEVGVKQAAATSAIGKAGLAIGTITQQTSATAAAGIVISESPAAGTNVVRGSKVSLIVSHGRT